MSVEAGSLTFLSASGSTGTLAVANGSRMIVAAQYTYDGTGLEDPALYSLSARGGGSVLPDCAESILEDEGVSTSANPASKLMQLC